MKASKSQLARIHIAKKDLALDDAVYRQILVNETGKRSAGDLSYGQAKTVIEYFEKAGWRPKGPVQGAGHKAQGEEERQRPGFASPRQLRAIRGMWAELSYAPIEKRQGALREFLRRFGVSDLNFLSFEGAGNVINALAVMKERKARGTRNIK